MNVVWLQQTETQIPERLDWLSLAERTNLNSLRFPKRRCDWLLGRWTAKRTVARYLGGTSPAPLKEIEIRTALSGAPEAFVAGKRADFSISLSHRVDTAMAVLAPSGLVGCDLECIEPHSDAFVADYFTPEEQLVICRSSARDQAALVSLLWSAKESALKALHLGLRLDTRSLLVSFAENVEAAWKRQHDCQELLRQSPPACGDPTEHGWSGFVVKLNGGLRLQGCWKRSANFVSTVIAEAALLPPAALDYHN